MSVYVRENLGSWELVDRHLFRGGEVNVKIPQSVVNSPDNFIDILSYATEHFSLMELVLVADAIRQSGNEVGDLYIPYLPYARQDRVCNPGEALSCKVAASTINSIKACRVITVDPHSDVMPAMIDNLVITPVNKALDHIDMSKYDMFVAPDAGAAKKVFKLAQNYKKEFGQGLKHRDVSTGALSHFSFHGDCKDKNLLIIDDICEGGGTFEGLAKILKDQGAKDVHLYVTHGIFSKGKTLNNIDKIFTTNSLGQSLIYSTDRKFNILNIL